MKKYIRNYLKLHNLTIRDYIPCKICQRLCRDFHHIHIKGMGGRKTFTMNGKQYDIDDPINIIPLCRECHVQAHAGKWTKQELIDFNRKNYEKQT